MPECPNCASAGVVAYACALRGFPIRIVSLLYCRVVGAGFGDIVYLLIVPVEACVNIAQSITSNYEAACIRENKTGHSAYAVEIWRTARDFPL